MKSDSSPPPPKPRRSVPAFAPVPLRLRADGWTPMRQADFLGALAETLSVAAAARRVGMTRESAYRLRDKQGAASFAAAWDAILLHRPPPRKVTGRAGFDGIFYGSLKPLMRRGRHVATLHSSSNDALLKLYRQEMTARRLGRRHGERSQAE